MVAFESHSVVAAITFIIVELQKADLRAVDAA
jgi:hypothetical protein